MTFINQAQDILTSPIRQDMKTLRSSGDTSGGPIDVALLFCKHAAAGFTAFAVYSGTKSFTAAAAAYAGSTVLITQAELAMASGVDEIAREISTMQFPPPR